VNCIPQQWLGFRVGDCLTVSRKLLVFSLLVSASPARTFDDPARAAQYLKAGAQYLRSGNLSAAEKELRKAIALDSRNPEIYNLLGFICDQTHRPDQAIQNFQAALKLNPGFTPARNNLGSSYLRQQKPELALEEFRQTLVFRPDDVTANYNSGVIYLQQGQPSKATAYLEKAHSVSPDDPAVLFNLSRCYFGTNRNDDGVRTALEMLKGGENKPGVFFEVGTLFLQNGLYELAAEKLARARVLSPRDPRILVALAEASVRAGKMDMASDSIEGFIEAVRQGNHTGADTAAQFSAARVVLSSLRQANPDSFKTNYQLAEILFLDHKYGEAVEVLKTLAEKAGNNSEYFNLLGMCYAGLNQFPDARQAVVKAINLAPARADFLFNLAGIYQKAGDNESALKILKQALAHDQNSPQIHFALGLSYFNRGSYAAALENFHMALKIQPDFPEAVFLVGRTYERLGNRPEAVAAFQKTVSMEPAYYPAHFQLALVLLKMGRTEEAVPLFERVVRLNPQFADAYYQLGKLHATRGDLRQASQEFEKCIAINPDHDDAYYQLGRVYAKLGNKEKAAQLFQEVNARKGRRGQKYEGLVEGDK